MNRYLYATTLEDSDTTVRGSKIDSDDSPVILICFCTCEKGGQETEDGEEGACP